MRIEVTIQFEAEDETAAKLLIEAAKFPQLSIESGPEETEPLDGDADEDEEEEEE